MQKPVIIKIGGSILSPSRYKLFDFEYAHKFLRLIKSLDPKLNFVICVGGGHTSRYFQSMSQDFGERDEVDVHKIGIAATNLNAELLHSVFSDIATKDVLRYRAYDEFVRNPDLANRFRHGQVIISAGSRPGRSNDWNGLEIAKVLGTNRVIDVKNVSGVYTADPRQDTQAELIRNLSWKQYLNLIGNPDKHAPGANYPVDPLTSRQAEKLGVEFVVVGADLENLAKVIKGQVFLGSVIR